MTLKYRDQTGIENNSTAD